MGERQRPTLPVIVCAAQRLEDAMQTQGLVANSEWRARSRISAASDEELPRRIRDEGWAEGSFLALPEKKSFSFLSPGTEFFRSISSGGRLEP